MSIQIAQIYPLLLQLGYYIRTLSILAVTWVAAQPTASIIAIAVGLTLSAIILRKVVIAAVKMLKGFFRKTATESTAKSANTKDVAHDSPKQQATEQEQNAAATKIQAVYRGFLARKELVRRKEEVAAAAVKIQAVYRGFLARKELVRRKEEVAAAAVKIQTGVRGFLARREVAKMKYAISVRHAEYTQEGHDYFLDVLGCVENSAEGRPMISEDIVTDTQNAYRIPKGVYRLSFNETIQERLEEAIKELISTSYEDKVTLESTDWGVVACMLKAGYTLPHQSSHYEARYEEQKTAYDNYIRLHEAWEAKKDELDIVEDEARRAQAILDELSKDDPTYADAEQALTQAIAQQEIKQGEFAECRQQFQQAEQTYDQAGRLCGDYELFEALINPGGDNPEAAARLLQNTPLFELKTSEQEDKIHGFNGEVSCRVTNYGVEDLTIPSIYAGEKFNYDGLENTYAHVEPDQGLSDTAKVLFDIAKNGLTHAFASMNIKKGADGNALYTALKELNSLTTEYEKLKHDMPHLSGMQFTSDFFSAAYKEASSKIENFKSNYLAAWKKLLGSMRDTLSQFDPSSVEYALKDAIENSQQPSGDFLDESLTDAATMNRSAYTELIPANMIDSYWNAQWLQGTPGVRESDIATPRPSIRPESIIEDAITRIETGLSV